MKSPHSVDLRLCRFSVEFESNFGRFLADFSRDSPKLAEISRSKRGTSLTKKRWHKEHIIWVHRGFQGPQITKSKIRNRSDLIFAREFPEFALQSWETDFYKPPLLRGAAPLDNSAPVTYIYMQGPDREQDFNMSLALNCPKGQHLSALEVFKNQSPKNACEIAAKSPLNMLNQKYASDPLPPDTRQKYEQTFGQDMTPNASKKGKIDTWGAIF